MGLDTVVVFQQAAALIGVVMLWRVVWRFLDLYLPLRFEDGGGKRACVEAGASVIIGLALLSLAQELPRDW